MKQSRENTSRICIVVAAEIYCFLLILVFGFKDGRGFSGTVATFYILPILVLLFVLFLSLRRSENISEAETDREFFDPITNRGNFKRFKLEAEKLFRENPNGKFVIFYSDIKNFKYINDVYGFETGNKILRRYSDLLGMENKIIFARVNADNFVSIESYSDEKLIVNECLKRIERVSDLSGIVEGTTTVSVFVGAYCTHGNNSEISIDGMIDRANIAQKQIKNKKQSGCIIYDEKFRESMLARQEMENRMRPALKAGEFVIYIQPKFDIEFDRIAAAEALVRWQDPELGLIPPLQFIPLFELNGFIKELDTYVFEQVCILIKSWIEADYDIVPISVNVSRGQLENASFVTDYVKIKNAYNIPDGLVEIEFTESMLFDNNEKMLKVLSSFRANGFRSSIDDFGSGYSSLNLLKDMPTDILKLDKLFFDKNEYQDREKVIIKNVILMAKELSMQTVAEGVEKWEQVEFLKSVKCEMVQGFVFDRPLPAAEFEAKYIKSLKAENIKNAAAKV